MQHITMDKPTNQKKLEKEIEKLKTLLQLSERRRLNQKLLYDKNLENLHEKLADFERILLKEQKEVKACLLTKEQQAKVQEELAKSLQNKLDSQYCRHCSYPTNKNKFDTADWEVDPCCSEKKTDYRKLPLLSLPLPDNSNLVPSRQSKSKLSPIGEESEVASSSYLRNIHADQNPDRFHAVLTASLECLQVNHVKKNITPESEYGEEEDNTPQHKFTLQKNCLDEFTEDGKLHNRYHTPRPSIDIHFCPLDEQDSSECVDEEPNEIPCNELLEFQNKKPVECCQNEEEEEGGGRKIPGFVSDYASSIAISILQKAFTGVTREQSVPIDNSGTPGTSTDTGTSCIESFSRLLASTIVPIGNNNSIGNSNTIGNGNTIGDSTTSTSSNCIETFSNKLAFNILRNINTNVDIFGNQSTTSQTTAAQHKKTLENREIKSDETVIEAGGNIDDKNMIKYDKNIKSDDGTILKSTAEFSEDLTLSRNILDADDTVVCNGDVGYTGNEEDTLKEEANITAVVAPLVDEAMQIAKSIVRRRSSTNTSSELLDENSEKLSEAHRNALEGNSTNSTNTSFSRKTLFELIDQAVENVIPNVNSTWKDADVSNLMYQKSAKNSLPLPNNVVPCENNTREHNDTAAACKNSESNVTENKENQSKSKKKRNKKKKKKKKGVVSSAGNCSPEYLEEMCCINSKELEVNIVSTVSTEDCSDDLAFDYSEVVSSSLNNSVSEINPPDPHHNDEDKFSMMVDESFNEMEASRGSTPDTLDGFQ